MLKVNNKNARRFNKLTIKKYGVTDVVLVLLLTLNIFYTFF